MLQKLNTWVRRVFPVFTCPIAPESRQKMITIGGQLFLEVFVPCDYVPKFVTVEGVQVKVRPFKSKTQVVMPGPGKFLAYGSTALGGILVYVMAATDPYCCAIWLTM